MQSAHVFHRGVIGPRHVLTVGCESGLLIFFTSDDGSKWERAGCAAKKYFREFVVSEISRSAAMDTAKQFGGCDSGKQTTVCS